MSKCVNFPQALFGFSKSNGVDSVYHTEGPSLTRQEFAEECDVNSIMARYQGHVIGGPGNLSAMGPPMYVDFAAMPGSLMEYMDFMQNADKAFMFLPAVVRKEFDNDPRMFVDFASDPENVDQMRTWGLAAPAPKEAPGDAKAAPGAGAPPAGEKPPGGAPEGSTHGST